MPKGVLDMKKLATLLLVGFVATFAVVASPAGAKQGRGHAVAGVVQAVGTGSLTLKVKRGKTIDVAVDAGTKIIVNGRAGALADIGVGFRALVKGRRGAPARLIRAHQAPHGRAVVRGIVDSVGSDSITVEDRAGAAVTIGVTGQTIIRVRGRLGTLEDIHGGYRATVLRAGVSGDALAIVALPPRG